MPVDITKTRLQTMKNNEYKVRFSPYTYRNSTRVFSDFRTTLFFLPQGTIDCLVKTVKNEGFFSLWKGFTPYFLRLGPHTIITFIALEQLNKVTAKF